MKQTHGCKQSETGRRRTGIALLAALVALAGSVASASAATFTVSNTNDVGVSSLREAIIAANTAAGADEIVFQAGLTGTIALGSDLPTITEALTITGPGPRLLSISGGNARRVMNAEARLTISGLRLANGFTDRGGGIRFAAANTMLHVFDCHFDQCLATNEGGAICIIDGSITAERVTFTTDQAAGSGGCIWYGQGTGSPTATITNCTFVNNFASGNGGAIRQFNATAFTSSVTNCTFVVNNAGTGGGAIAVAGGTMTLNNSLFTANGAGGNPGGHVGSTAGTITSLGHNLFGHLDGANFAPDATDKFGTVPAQLNTGILIAFPFNNGGLTDTLPPVNNTSILIDGGGVAGAPTGDQRGFPRVGCAPDVGAFEVQTVTDTDGDGVINCLDTCPNTPACASVNQTGCPTDSDGDGVFDGCDLCPGTLAGDPVNATGCSTADEDGDGVTNDADLCRGTPACAIASVNASGCPTDADADGLFDGCDRCPGANDLTDTDADGIPDCLDACPAVGDTDGDGVQDCQDGCPADGMKLAPGGCGCGVVDTDTDADGVPDCSDGCPNDAAKLAPGACGCGNVDTDTDADGVADCLDGCPTDAAKLSPGACGCGNADTDTDADGVADCKDGCPNDALKLSPGACGCGNADTDTDADGVADCKDGCPNDPLKLSLGACGCGNADTDTDADGVADCKDGCPNDPLKLAPGVCGCGASDADTNANGIPDCADPAPPAPQPTPAPQGGLGAFIPISPVLPGGVVCGYGLAVPTLLMAVSFLVVGRRHRRRR